MENEIDKLKDRFVTGFCQAATPFSAKKDFDSCLKLRAKRVFEEGKVNFWDDGWGESVCYFGGGVLGLTFIPIDAINVAFGSMKKKLKLLA